MARRVWRVSRRGDSWQVKRDGATRATKSFATKDEALDAAMELARANSPSRVVLHGVDGTVERETEYGEAAGLSYAGVFEGPDDLGTRSEKYLAEHFSTDGGW
jgi:hypothetical protein